MFTNEMITEDDINKYDLDNMLKTLNPWVWRNGRPSIFKHNWTVDRERNAFLIYVGLVEEVGRSGRNEPTNKHIFILNYYGSQYKVLLEKLLNSSSSFNDSPFNIYWRILEITPISLFFDKENEIINAVKDAVAVYGHRGALLQIPNTVVEFDTKAEN